MPVDDSRPGLVWRAVNAVTILFCLAAVLLSLYALNRGGLSGQGLDYKDLISILLTSIGIMIALAALLVAVLAIWGFEAGKKLLIESARQAAIDQVNQIVPPAIERMVPGLVEDNLRFLREGAESGNPDEIAEAYSKESRE